MHLIGIYSATLGVEMDQVLPKHGGVMGTYIKGRDVLTLGGAVLQVRVHTADVFQNVFILFKGAGLYWIWWMRADIVAESRQ